MTKSNYVKSEEFFIIFALLFIMILFFTGISLILVDPFEREFMGYGILITSLGFMIHLAIKYKLWRTKKHDTKM